MPQPPNVQASTPAMAAKPHEVAVLLCKSDLEMALTCLGSLGRYSAEPLRFRVHDDGTLDQECRDRLSRVLGAVRFISRPEADERMAEILRRAPAAARYRASHVFGLKLFDITFLAPKAEIFYCDSDILFRRPFSGLFRFPAPEAGALFMADLQNAYSVRSWHLVRFPAKLRLVARVCAGLLAFRRESYDLELADWYLGQPDFRFAPVWMEQTCWSLLGRRAGCWRWDSRQITMPFAGMEKLDPIAVHFVSPARGLLAPMVAAERSRDGEPAEIVRSFPAAPLTPWGLATTELSRRVRRLVGR